MKYIIGLLFLALWMRGDAQNNGLDKLSLAGKNPYQLVDEFYFNKKIHFQTKWEGAVYDGYFFINTKTGISLIDRSFLDEIENKNATEAHITFPENKEYFVYFTEPHSGVKYSRISHTSLPVGPPLLESPEEVLRYFKDWFSGPGSDVLFLGDKQNLKSESYATMYDGDDVTLYLSGQTQTHIQANYCVGWLGLGYLNRSTGQTEIITRLVSVSGNYQINLLREEDVNHTFSGKPYTPIQAKINEKIDKITAEHDIDKLKTTERITRSNDATEADLQQKLQQAKDKKMEKATRGMGKVGTNQGKIEDYHKLMSQMADPIDDIDLFEAELNLKMYQLDKKIKQESNATKKTKLLAEKKAQQNAKDKLMAYRDKFQFTKDKYQNNSKKLVEENSKLLIEMMKEMKIWQ